VTVIKPLSSIDCAGSLGLTSHRDLKTIPNFQAFILPKAGHAAYLDQPDQFHTLLYNFAKKIDSFPW
jgi:pimeloyl-ACP methyl ester carboxylesterase